MEYTSEEYLDRIENKRLNSTPLYSREEMIDFAEKYAKQLRIGVVSNSEVFEHYGKPFTSGRDLWEFLTAHYNFTPKT